MEAILDSSVVLRKLFGEPGPLDEWGQIGEGFTSRLTSIEVKRVIDRKRLAGELDDEEVARAHEQFEQLSRSLNVMPLDERVFAIAEAALPTSLGSLDALHLATAVLLKRERPAIVLATHDLQLARAARASCNLNVPRRGNLELASTTR
jgi:predicted nucleic acid-binding protein